MRESGGWWKEMKGAQEHNKAVGVCRQNGIVLVGGLGGFMRPVAVGCHGVKPVHSAVDASLHTESHTAAAAADRV